MKTTEKIKKAIAKAPYSYRTHIIKEKRAKIRLLGEPSETTKKLQKSLVHVLFEGLKISDEAIGYRKGLSNAIQEACKKHLPFQHTISMDIKNFFPSIKEKDIVYHLQRSGHRFKKAQMEVIYNILFSKHPKIMGLPMGSVSAPIISNIVMYEFDELLKKRIAAVIDEFCYMRYADDIFLSLNDGAKLRKVAALLHNHVYSNKAPRLRVNESKTRFGSKNQTRKLLGLYIQPTGNITLGTIRRKKYEYFLHRYSKGLLTGREICSLQGMLNHARMSDEGFYSKMIRRYGEELVGTVKGEIINLVEEKEYKGSKLASAIIDLFLTNTLLKY